MHRSALLLVAAIGWGATPGPAMAAEFRAVGDNPAILYDAPSTKARKLYVLSRGYPVEIVVTLEGWAKIRDAQGGLSWIESRHLVERRTVTVKSARAEVREAPADNAPVVFQAAQDVVLELLEVGATGWVRVRHSDGAAGYLRLTQVWGV